MSFSINNEFSPKIFEKIKEYQKSIEKRSDLQEKLKKLEHQISILSFYQNHLLKLKSSKKYNIIPQKTLKTEPALKSSNFSLDLRFQNSKLYNTNNALPRKTYAYKSQQKNNANSTYTNNIKSNLFMTNLNFSSTSRKISPPKNIENNFFPNLTNDDKTRNKMINMKQYNTFNRSQLPKIADEMILNIQKQNNKLNNKIFMYIKKFNLIDWYMKSRFKYANYKYSVAEIQKYFMDLKSFGKPEEEELDKRKTFYEHVEDIMNDITKSLERKRFENLHKRYGVKNDIKKNKRRNEKSEGSLKNKAYELSKTGEEILKRKEKERKKRQKIENILFDNKKILKIIDNYQRKLY